jgi:hypothetical protein
VIADEFPWKDFAVLIKKATPESFPSSLAVPISPEFLAGAR